MHSDPNQAKWQQRYASESRTPQPAAVLREQACLLPGNGEALDLACGLGGNALLLAQHGLSTQAWDYAPAAVAQLQDWAANLPLQAKLRDVEQNPPKPNSFDVITVSYFLHRAGLPAVLAAVRPGGLIFYETWGPALCSSRGPSNPDFRLRAGELRSVFRDWNWLFYREPGQVGDCAQGLRDVVQLVAQRPSI